MSMDSPVAVLFDTDGNPLSVQDGVAIPASTPGLMLMGSDGVNSRYVLIDSARRVIVAGSGIAGTPAGGVLSVQGLVGGTPLPISGSVTATDASVGLNGAVAPTSSTQVGGSDGTNIQAERVFDLDTGAGTEWNLGVSIRLPGAGGSVAGGTSGSPIRTDPTGTTTQPIFAVSLPLPTGAATEATLAGVLTTTAFQARINTFGQKTMAASTPVVLASDQTAISLAPEKNATAARTNVAASLVTQVILAANASRTGATIYNDSNQRLHLNFAATASTTDFTVKLQSDGYYEVPFGYTGVISGVWNVVNGTARVTEITP
jgi:hypothetical protein